MANSILICHPGRCGSHWLLYLLQRLTGLERPTVEPNPYAPLPGIIWGTQAFLPRVPDSGVDVVFLIRDPRDVIVSADAFEQAMGHAHFTAPVTGTTTEQVMDWFSWYLAVRDTAPGFTVRYEDLKVRPMWILTKLLAYFGRPLPTTAEVSGAIQAESFRARTGREPGHEDATQHNRKGIVGDWCNKWDATTLVAFENQYGHQLAALGYGT